MGEEIDCALDLTRRLPPQNIEENLTKLINLVPHLQESLLENVDQTLKIKHCEKSGKDYLVSAYNSDGNSSRSPWTNEYDPPLPEANTASSRVRKLEVIANDAFDIYRQMYYEGGGVSSAYFWDEVDGKEGFSGAVLFKKVGSGDDKHKTKASWDSIHVFDAGERGRNAHYALTSTVMLYTDTTKSKLGNFNLSGSMTRQFEADYPIDEPQTHIANIGRMIEDMELKLRNLLQEVYFGKTKDILNGLRSVNSIIEAKKQEDIRKELVGRLMERKTS